MRYIRIEIARRKGRPGDILVLAEETPNSLLEFEALRSAAKALLQMQRPRYALTIIPLIMLHRSGYPPRRYQRAYARNARTYAARSCILSSESTIFFNRRGYAISAQLRDARSDAVDRRAACDGQRGGCGACVAYR
jgi:hypothetical protein